MPVVERCPTEETKTVDGWHSAIFARYWCAERMGSGATDCCVTLFSHVRLPLSALFWALQHSCKYNHRAPCYDHVVSGWHVDVEQQQYREVRFIGALAT